MENMNNIQKSIFDNQSAIKNNILGGFCDEKYFEKAHNYGKEKRVLIVDKNGHTRVVYRKVEAEKFSDGSNVPTYSAEIFNQLSQDTTTSRNTVDEKFNKKRTNLHKEIYNSYLSGLKESEHPTLVLLAGGGGSGKGHVADSKILSDPMYKDFVTVNNDDIKYMLPESAIFTEEDPYSAANRLHQESSYITKALVRQIRAKKANLIFDTTCADTEKTLKMINAFKQCGYKIHLIGVLCDREVCKKSNRQRFLHKKRYVPDFIISKDNIDARSTMHNLISKHKQKLESVIIYDNSKQLEKEQPKMIYDNGEVLDEQSMNKLNKYNSFQDM